MIAQKQKPGIVRHVQRDVEKLKQWVLEQLKIKQKPQLDLKVKEISLKQTLKKKVTISLGKGVGRSLGKPLGSLRRLGRSVTKIFGF